MAELDLVMGIDSSTQSTSAVVLNRKTFETVADVKIKYRDDPRLAKYGLTEGAPILAPRETGEADQPACLFLDALEALLSDIGPAILGRVAAIDLSAQQHGQVFVASEGSKAIAELRTKGSGAAGAPSLSARIGRGLASDRAPIWMSTNTAVEAEEIRAAMGGRDAMTARSGSDSPLRFSGAVLRRVAKRFPDVYAATHRAHLISSFLSGVLAGESDAPIDWGNGSGTSLMDWSGRKWDRDLIAAAAAGLPGGAEGLASKLPKLVHPLTVIGTVAAFFVERYGLSPDCAIVAGSGDNPQSKVLANGAMLSLGTSFVFMVEGAHPHVMANAMYDGLGRPFLFGVRQNGALALEAVAIAHGLKPNDFPPTERALAAIPPGSTEVRAVHLDPEILPPAPAGTPPSLGSFEKDYCAAVDSGLGLLAVASASFAGALSEIAVTGGAARSPGIMARIAAIWGVPATPISNAGASAGAAVAAACAIAPESEREALAAKGRAVAASPGKTVQPDPEAVKAYRGPGGFLEKVAKTI